jgi:hypothetical protein
MTVAGFGESVTLATGAGVMVTLAVPLLPPADAVIVTEPVATPVTNPVWDTVANAVLLELHVTGRSVTTVPFRSLTVTASCTV